ncbi:hypothetical protein AHMF7605_21865 [Adhaeribacter arboris]|uniref:Lipoprotein n=1 Tax=Adhaeribacter arboris TaxID=2072846 RepID=A0A2T2YKE2_9BACT|nr:hypothetical protein [Adhaeribacter arboris]PSR55959.1 hypothetical protein AHMF7605_21865 [Adhaeribacter arboris]
MKKMQMMVLAVLVLSSCSKDREEIAPKMKETTSASQLVQDQESLTKQKLQQIVAQVVAQSKKNPKLPADFNKKVGSGKESMMG